MKNISKKKKLNHIIQHRIGQLRLRGSPLEGFNRKGEYKTTSMQKMNFPRKLKADLHIHTREDPEDKIKYTAKELIDEASHQKFDVLAITNHNLVTYDDYLKKYALDKGILLIPGAELKIEGKHIILLNINDGLEREIRTLEELRSYKNENSLIIAPHPYFPMFASLGAKLDQYIHIFDALEYTHFYFRRINFNRKAERKARKYNLSLVGVSDAHRLNQFGLTYSLIDAEKTPRAVIRAIKENKVEIVTRPIKLDWFNVILGLKHMVGQIVNPRKSFFLLKNILLGYAISQECLWSVHSN